MRAFSIRLPVACLVLCAASSLACGGGSSTTTDSGVPPTGDSGHTGKDAGHGGDAGHGSKDSGHPSDSGHPKGDSGVTLDAGAAACAALAAAQCAKLAACDPNDVSGRYGDGGGCIERQSLTCMEALAAPNTARTPANDQACATATASESCEATLDTIDPSACLPPAGPREAGAGCEFAAQCASAYCAIPTNSRCGTCAAPTPPDASCAGISACAGNLDCFKNHCVNYAGDGGACSDLQPCASGLGCVIPAEAGAGTCEPKPTTSGAACDQKLQTGPDCNTASGVYCVARKSASNYHQCAAVSISPPNGGCDYLADGGYGVCSNDSTCLVTGMNDAGFAVHTCVPNAADDAGCNNVTGPDCERPAKCVGTAIDGGTQGTCALYNASCA